MGVEHAGGHPGRAGARSVSLSQDHEDRLEADGGEGDRPPAGVDQAGEERRLVGLRPRNRGGGDLDRCHRRFSEEQQERHKAAEVHLRCDAILNFATSLQAIPQFTRLKA